MSGSPDHFLTALTERAQVRAEAARVAEAGRGAPAVRAPARALEAALRRRRFGLIAEAKRRSPSRGVLAPGAYDAGQLARRYEEAGAAAVSVLTEPHFFDGRLDDLRAARAATALPLLRKDFILDPAQVRESAREGADAVLAIVRILTRPALGDLLAEADRWGVDVLVEVHSRSELDMALEAGARLVGVNNRDLDTFVTDWRRSLALAAALPPGVLAVAESGIRDLSQVVELERHGYRAALVGEAVMTEGVGLVEAVRAWVGA